MNKRQREERIKQYWQHPLLMQKPIVLYGAGAQGRKKLRFLKNVGVEPIAFCDSAASKIGTIIETVRGNVGIRSLSSIIEEFGTDGCMYIVTSAFHYAEIAATLSNAGIPDSLILSPAITQYLDTGIIERPIEVTDEMQAELQDIMLELMLEFKRICGKHNIKYFRVTTETREAEQRRNGER